MLKWFLIVLALSSSLTLCITAARIANQRGDQLTVCESSRTEAFRQLHELRESLSARLGHWERGYER